MNSLNFCGPSTAAVYPLHGVNSMLLDLHHQMAEQYHAYSAGSPAAHTLSVAERLAGRAPLPPDTEHRTEPTRGSAAEETLHLFLNKYTLYSAFALFLKKFLF